MNGKRKFYAYMISIGVFLLLTGFVISKIDVVNDSTLSGIVYAFGGAITAIAGAFYVGNFGEHFAKNKGEDVNK